MKKRTNILDPVQSTLDPTVWIAPSSPMPKLKSAHRNWIEHVIHTAFNQNGYEDSPAWAVLFLTGSLTTYQYSEDSDVDISVFVDMDTFPDWTRAELIGVAVDFLDGQALPNTTHPLQVYIVPAGLTTKDLYKRGLRSAYDLQQDSWVVPPEPERSMDTERELNGFYTYALEEADKMEHLLRYEPGKAMKLWDQIHRQRSRDQANGKGDYSIHNLAYKMLTNRPHIVDQLRAVGAHIV